MAGDRITGKHGHQHAKEKGDLHIKGRLTISPLWKTEVCKMKDGRTGYCGYLRDKHQECVRPIRYVPQHLRTCGW